MIKSIKTMAEENQLTPEEMNELRSLGLSIADEQPKGIFQFFTNILGLTDTSKAGFLSDEELYSVRIFQDTADFADLNYGENSLLGNYINRMAERVLATSLSKKGFLIDKSISTKKQVTSKGLQTKKKWLSKSPQEEV